MSRPARSRRSAGNGAGHRSAAGGSGRRPATDRSRAGPGRGHVVTTTGALASGDGRSTRPGTGRGSASDLLRSPHGGTRGRLAGARPAWGACRSSPGTDLTVTDLCLGGEIFGWTADEPTTHAVLHRFVDAVPGC